MVNFISNCICRNEFMSRQSDFDWTFLFVEVLLTSMLISGRAMGVKQENINYGIWPLVEK